MKNEKLKTMKNKTFDGMVKKAFRGKGFTEKELVDLILNYKLTQKQLKDIIENTKTKVLFSSFLRLQKEKQMWKDTAFKMSVLPSELTKNKNEIGCLEEEIKRLNSDIAMLEETNKQIKSTEIMHGKVNAEQTIDYLNYLDQLKELSDKIIEKDKEIEDNNDDFKSMKESYESEIENLKWQKTDMLTNFKNILETVEGVN